MKKAKLRECLLELNNKISDFFSSEINFKVMKIYPVAVTEIFLFFFAKCWPNIKAVKMTF